MSTFRWCIDKAAIQSSGKDVYEIQGWIWDKKENKLQVKIFGNQEQELPYKIVWKRRPDVQKYLGLREENLKLGFIVTISNMSQYWEKGGQLCLVFSNSAEKIQVYERELSDIRKSYIRGFTQYNVDSACIVGDMVMVKGWALYKQKECPIYVQDGKGQGIEYELEKEMRPDVNGAFSLDQEIQSGFFIKFSKKYLSKGQVFLVFKNPELKVKYELSARKIFFSNSKVGKYYAQLGPGKMRGNINYIRNHGWGEFRKKLYINLNPANQGYGYWAKLHTATGEELRREKKVSFSYHPIISIVIPLYNTPLKYLEELLKSVTGQTYGNWQLCLADGSPKDDIEKYLEKKYKKEKRIVYKRLEKNGGISENTNGALELASGEYIMLSDHDDVLEKNALYEIVKVLNMDNRPDVIYTDEDKVTMDGKEYFDPHFKPDFNWDFLRSNNYICHIFVVSRKIVDEVGLFRKEYDGAQDFDFILRCCEKAEHIWHIPKVLYHWRSHPNSTAGNPASKMYAYENGKRAVEAHYQRIGQKAQVFMTPYWGRYRSKLGHEGNPLVSIIIPNKDCVENLDRCISSIYEKSTYKNIEILIIENGSEKDETFAFYTKVQQERENFKVLYWKELFNYATVNNYGASQAKGEFLIFLHSDTEIITPDWIEEMLGYCQRQDTGVVGVRLYYPNNTVQHAGMVLGLGIDHVAGNVFYKVKRSQFTYGGRGNSTQNISAVSSACMMVKKSLHDEVGGFDKHFERAYCDVDYCLRIKQLGKQVVFQAFVELYHYKSRTKASKDAGGKRERFYKEAQLFKERWEEILKKGDPYYNPNLTLKHSDCSIKWEK